MVALISRDRAGLPTLETPGDLAVDARLDEAPLGKRVRTGAMWNVASNLLLRLSNILIIAVVARLVTPQELGVFALAVALYVLLADMAVLGVASAIARADLDADRIGPTVVTISVGSSLLLALLMAVFADPLAAMLGAGQAADAIRIMSICVLLLGVCAVPAAQLQRDFRQDALFRANVISFLPSSAVLITLASVGDGTIAFAWSRVAAQLVIGYVMIRNLDRKYLPGLNATYVRPLLQFGLPLALANVLSQILLNLDYVFVGRLMTTADVGLYMLAFTVCAWPTALLGPLLNSMILPAFSRLKRDGGDFSEALSYAVRIVALVACPMAAFVCAFATPLITVVYGDTWAAAGPVLAVLSLYGMIFVLGLLFANVIISTGRTFVLFVVQIAAILALVPALAVGVHLGGLVGIGVAHILVIAVVTLPAYLFALRKSTGVAPRTVFRALARPLGAAVVASIVARLAAATVQNDVLRLAVGGSTAVVVYVSLTAPLLFQIVPVRVFQRRQAVGVKGRHARPRARRRGPDGWE